MSKKPTREELEKRIQGLEKTVSDHKRAQEGLRENKEHLWLLTENASDIMQIADSEGVIRYVGPSVQQVLVGYKADELIDKLTTDLIHLEALPLFTKGFVDVKYPPDRSITVESRCKHKEDRWRVVNNVLTYAAQVTPRGGVIQVAGANLLLNDHRALPFKPGAYIHIAIKDTGLGIAGKHGPIMFAPYVTAKHEGICLSLAMAYSIIQKYHAGAITVQTTLGAGRTFHIYLPASNTIIPEENEDRLMTGHGRILVMDDEVPLRRMVRAILDQLDYAAGFVEHRAEAIAMYEEAKKSGTSCDTVILDLVA